MKFSRILHIDKPEDCGGAAEKSTLSHQRQCGQRQTKVSNGLCSGTILYKHPVFENYKYIIIMIIIIIMMKIIVITGDWYLLNYDLSD